MPKQLGVAVAAAALATTPFAWGGQEADPATADRILLKSGDVLSGRIVSADESALVLEHPELGALTIAADKVERFGPAESVGIKMPLDQVAEEAKKKAEEQAAEDAKKAWQIYASLAFAGDFNSNDEISLRLGFGASRERETDRFNFTAEYYLRTLDGDTTDNSVRLHALQSWFFKDSPWLIFAQGGYQYDEFEAWEHRFTVYGGPGYKLIDTDPFNLTLRAGAGVMYEVGPDEWTPQVLLAEEFSWKISSRQRFRFDSSIAPSVTDLNDYLLTVGTEYSLAIDDSKKGLSFNAGLLNIYDNKPSDGSSHNDLRVYAGLRYDF